MASEHLAKHFIDLCREHGIEVGSHSSGGRAYRKGRRVNVRPIKSAITYAVAMHELGHILGPRQSGTRLDKEVGAWEWAHDNALEWTDAMEAKMQKCLCSYLAWSKRRRGARQADANHPIHSLIGETDASLARMATLTGICPRCGDGGWWIENAGKFYCDCPAGRTALSHAKQEERP